MKKPALVIMAAGMGSRYGGLKQIDKIDEEGHIIIDFSIYDAITAGFEKIIFVIKQENEKDFKEAIGRRMEKVIEVDYVFQDLNNIPAPFVVPEGREKPWGTGHAILSCIDKVEGPFAIINADDYYGQKAFKVMYDYLVSHEDDDKYRYAMVGYVLDNTLTDNGYVARGVCEMDEQANLVEINERTHIQKHNGETAYTEDDGKTWTTLSGDSTVSMNLFGFTPSILQELKKAFPLFLEENIKKNPLKCEFFIPTVVSNLLKEAKATVKVLKSEDKWYGVTYKEDKEVVVKAIAKMKEEGLYPENLWEEK